MLSILLRWTELNIKINNNQINTRFCVRAENKKSSDHTTTICSTNGFGISRTIGDIEHGMVPPKRNGNNWWRPDAELLGIINIKRQLY